VQEVTASLGRVLGKQPEHTHIVIQEIEEENWRYAGLLTDDWKRQQSQAQ
jgi:4-oxalocrotonate tautomerase